MDYFSKMDGAGGYVRASLLGLSQGLSPLHDPLRLHPALHSQISDIGKDGSGLLRPLTDYPHLPLLPFSAPPFLPPMHLDPRLPFSHSAFHQLHNKLPQVSTSTSSNASTIITSSPSLQGSAFAPLPPKVSKMDPDGTVTSIASVTAGLFPHSVLLTSALDARNAFLGGRSPPLVSGGPLSDERRDSPSPMGSHGSRESPGQLREASTPTSPGDDMRVRKNRASGEYWCPVCKSTLRPGEYDSHLGLEMEKLARLIPPSHPQSVVSSIASVTSSLSTSPHGNPPVKMRDPGWETYQRVKANRQVRLRTKKRRSGRGDEMSCPVCAERVSASTHEEFQNHVEQCVRRQSVPEEEEVDVEGDSSFEEYEWCGQRRVRVPSALLRQQQQTMQVNREGDTETSSDKDPSNISDKTRLGGGRDEGRECGSVDGGGGGCEEERRGREEERVGDVKEKIPADVLEKELEALKEKIRSMERDAGVNTSKFQCLVCQNVYDRPAVSMICWHVFCEACWPHSMETKSECPQCSVAFNAEDIRIIQL